MTKKLLLFFMIFSVSGVAVSAQSNLGTIEGQALDPNGAVIPRAQIKLISTNGKTDGNPPTVLTNESGEFRFYNLAFGRYELQMKVSWSEAIVKKQVEIKAENPDQTNLRIIIEGCSGEETKDSGSVTGEDKAEIVRQMLKLLIGKHSNLLVNEQLKSKLILSTENIEAGWLNAEDKQKFNLLNQSEIQYLADSKSDFLYLKFSKLKVKGNCVETSLDNIWAVGKNSRTLYLSGGGNTYEFRKVEKRWVGKLFTSWIS
jgi:hypothetical protein